MGRAGGSGGSRSGGASRHSTGSRSTSSSRSSSSLSNRPPRSYSGGGFGSNRGGFNHNPYSPPPPPPPRPRYRPHFSTRYNSPTYYNGSSFHTAPLGCGSTVIKIIIATVTKTWLKPTGIWTSSWNSKQKTKKKHKRVRCKKCK